MSDLLLRAWEAVSERRHINGVLQAITDVLVPEVPFDSLGVVSFVGETHDLFAAHIVGNPSRDGESLEEYLLRSQSRKVFEVPVKPALELDYGPIREATLAAMPYTCADLWKREAWYEHEFILARGGVRAYASAALFAGGELVGTSVYSRLEPEAFTAGQLRTLNEVARPLGVAVANALANEQVRKLRDQLEAENIALRAALGQAPWFEEVAGSSAALRRVLESVEQVAATDATVLITGETGTGKELIARAIHRRSPRVHGPMVKVNCAAIPESLLASELFGHERGAFTGAIERRRGRFEQAQGGTLFLDEVGEMPAETQVLLLRVLQEREFERLGGSQTVRADVRIVAATNRDLAAGVRAGRFRSDLFYRLSVFPIHMPPLRDRLEDIPVLVAHFAQKYGERFSREVARIDAKALDDLRRYDWPGNVRELENAVERAVILARQGTLRVEPPGVSPAPPRVTVGEDLRAREREAVEAALRESRGRISGRGGAAERLGMAASTLEFRVRRLGINKFAFRVTA